MSKKNIIIKVCKKYGEIKIKKDQLSFAPYALNINNGYFRNPYNRNKLDGAFTFMFWDKDKWNGEDSVDLFLRKLFEKYEHEYFCEYTEPLEKIRIMYRQWVYLCIFRELICYANDSIELLMTVRIRFLQKILENHGELDTYEGKSFFSHSPFISFSIEDSLGKYYVVDLSNANNEEEIWSLLRDKYKSNEWKYELPLNEDDEEYVLKRYFVSVVNEKRRNTIYNLLLNLDIVYGNNSINKEEYIKQFFEELEQEMNNHDL